MKKESEDRIKGYNENSSRITEAFEKKADKSDVNEVRTALIEESSVRIKNYASKVSKEEFISSQEQQDNSIQSLNGSQEAQNKRLDSLSTDVGTNKETSQNALQKAEEGIQKSTVNTEKLNTLNNDLQKLSEETQQGMVRLNGKVDSIQKEERGGIAVTAAMTNIPQAIHAGKGNIGVGTANFKGSNGVALGGSYRFSDDQTTIKGSVGKSSSYTVVGVGASYEF